VSIFPFPAFLVPVFLESGFDRRFSMIAVMTMNLGYFMSVLGGVFLGSMVFGRFMARSAAH